MSTSTPTTAAPELLDPPARVRCDPLGAGPTEADVEGAHLRANAGAGPVVVYRVAVGGRTFRVPAPETEALPTD